MQQEYFHTHKGSDLYFEIVMKNHEKKKGRNISLFLCQEIKR